MAQHIDGSYGYIWWHQRLPWQRMRIATLFWNVDFTTWIACMKKTTIQMTWQCLWQEGYLFLEQFDTKFVFESCTVVTILSKKQMAVPPKWPPFSRLFSTKSSVCDSSPDRSLSLSLVVDSSSLSLPIPLKSESSPSFGIEYCYIMKMTRSPTCSSRPSWCCHGNGIIQYIIFDKFWAKTNYTCYKVIDLSMKKESRNTNK